MFADIGTLQFQQCMLPSCEVAKTLDCMHDAHSVLCYENHAQDSRVKGPIAVAQTLGASNANSLGTSGNNPLVLHSIAFCPGVARRRGGDNRFTTELSPTVTSNTGDNVPAVCQPYSHEH